MTLSFKKTHCKHCNRDTVAFKAKLNHGNELILSLLTGGLWSIAWLARYLYTKPWRCGECSHWI